MTSLILVMQSRKLYKPFTVVMIVILVIMLMPISVAIGAELGGYISEKVISRSGTNNSQLVIGSANTNNSLLDIINCYVEGIPNPNMNPDSGEYRLNTLIPLVMMSMVIFMLIKMMSTGELNVIALILAATLIIMFYAFLPGIWELIVGLLGG